MIVDTHAHSTFSVDGHSSIEEMARAAIAKGAAAIGFAEHVDYDPADRGYGFFNFETYSSAIERARDKHSGRIEILKGIEFSEPQLYGKELDRLNELDFDFILGSVHCVVNAATANAESIPAAELDGIYERHYLATLAACRRGGFDALAHIDLPARYLAERREPAALIEEVLKAMVEKGISLEVNTWCLRKGMAEGSPSAGILSAYEACGGEFVTTGSDAHNARDVAARMPVAMADGFKTCFYRGRKRVLAQASA